MISLFLKCLLGAVAVLLIALLSRSRNFVIAGLVPLFPTFALIAHYMVGSERSAADLRATALFGLWSLLPYAAYLLTVYWPGTCLRPKRGRASTFSGWDARRGATPIVHLWASAATPQTAREGTCPSGWDEIGRLSQPSPCMGISPCGVPSRPTHPDCIPTRPRLDPEQVLRVRIANPPAPAHVSSNLTTASKSLKDRSHPLI